MRAPGRARAWSAGWRQAVWRPGMDDAAREAPARPYRERLAYELDVIAQMKFPGYFLIVSDFIKWAKANGIPVGPGPRLGRRLGRRLEPDDHRPRPAALRPAVRALPQPRARVDARLRHRLLRGPARRGDHLRPRPLRRATGSRRSSPSARCRPAPPCATSAACCGLPFGLVDRICKLVPHNPANPVTLAQAIEMEPRLQGGPRRRPERGAHDRHRAAARGPAAATPRPMPPAW